MWWVNDRHRCGQVFLSEGKGGEKRECRKLGRDNTLHLVFPAFCLPCPLVRVFPCMLTVWGVLLCSVWYKMRDAHFYPGWVHATAVTIAQVCVCVPLCVCVRVCLCVYPYVCASVCVRTGYVCCAQHIHLWQVMVLTIHKLTIHHTQDPRPPLIPKLPDNLLHPGSFPFSLVPSCIPAPAPCPSYNNLA